VTAALLLAGALLAAAPLAAPGAAAEPAQTAAPAAAERAPAAVRDQAPAPTIAAGALRTVEGKVVAVGEAPGEAQLALLTLDLATGDGTLALLVAPPAALADAGFAVAVGDEVRARIFVAPEGGAAHVQKLLNRTQSLMVHLRTLRREPLWDAAGRWQGAAPGGTTTRPGASPTRPTRRGQPTRRRPPPPNVRPGGDG
jgi:hypothetical protein